MQRIALKTLTREKKAPVVETVKSSFDRQVQQVAKPVEESLYTKRPNESFIWINDEYNEDSPNFNPDKTLQDWLNIKGITLAELPNFNPDNERITNTPNVSGITRVRLPKLVTGVDVCIITLGEFIKLVKNKLDYVSQTRLYFEKHEGFLPEGVKQNEKDGKNTSYYSKLSCSPENVEKLKQYVKMNFRTDKVKWL